LNTAGWEGGKLFDQPKYYSLL